MTLIRLLFGFLAVLSAMFAPAAGLAKPLAPALVAQSGRALYQSQGPSGVSGWMLVDLETGVVMDSANADRGFVPASVAKLPTAAFALDALGPGYRFRTSVLVEGDRLTLSGGGDPELDTDRLAALVAGVRSIGRIRQFIVDGTALPEIPEIDPDQGVDAGYNPSLSGLNLNFNRVHVKWDARGNRRQLTVEAEAERLSPPVSGVQVTLSDSPSAPLFSHRIVRGVETWAMARRAFRGRGARWLPVKNPERYAGEVFALLARRNGMRLPAPREGRGAGREVAHIDSRPLGEIARDMLRFSTNLTAEAVGTMASRQAGRQVASLKASADTMNLWAAGVGGFAPGDPGFLLANHSGLSLDSRVSPRRMVDLLLGLARRQPDPLWRHARLPGRIAGYLRRYNVADAGFPLDYDRLDVVAKTGTISYVRGLAGYIATPGGRRLGFAIFSNNLARRSGGAEKVNKHWMRQAKAFERALIRNWVLAADQTGG